MSTEYRRVRLDALRLHPEAFGAVLTKTRRRWIARRSLERLATPGFTRFGGFDGGSLVGLAGCKSVPAPRNGTRPICSACMSMRRIGAPGWRSNWSKR